jgi:hypothetical protein
MRTTRPGVATPRSIVSTAYIERPDNNSPEKLNPGSAAITSFELTMPVVLVGAARGRLVAVIPVEVVGADARPTPLEQPLTAATKATTHAAPAVRQSATRPTAAWFTPKTRPTDPNRLANHYRVRTCACKGRAFVLILAGDDVQYPFFLNPHFMLFFTMCGAVVFSVQLLLMGQVRASASRGVERRIRTSGILMLASADWYADASCPGARRWWDGRAWTAQRQT